MCGFALRLEPSHTGFKHDRQQGGRVMIRAWRKTIRSW
jgi:hypothetical protein